MKGHFITFEGLDGSGKTTLIEGVEKALIERGLSTLKTYAPGGTPPGKVIRQLVLHPEHPLVARAELLLFLADRAQQVKTVIEPALQEGKVVLCDRYNDSTLAYQGKARGLPFDEVSQMCRFATDNLKPELTLYLDLDPEEGLSRVQSTNHSKDYIEQEDLAFHHMIRSAFHEFAAQEPERFQIIDAEKSKEEVLSQALHLIDEYCFRVQL